MKIKIPKNYELIHSGEVHKADKINFDNCGNKKKRGWEKPNSFIVGTPIGVGFFCPKALIIRKIVETKIDMNYLKKADIEFQVQKNKDIKLLKEHCPSFKKLNRITIVNLYMKFSQENACAHWISLTPGMFPKIEKWANTTPLQEVLEDLMS